MKTSKVAVAACAFVVALATVGLVCAEEFRSPVLFKSDVNFDNGSVIKVQGTTLTATAAQLNAAGDGSTASLTPTTVTASGFIITTPLTQNVTNGQPVTLSGSLNVLTGINGTNGATDTITLADPGTAGKLAVIVVGAASTNFVGLADSGNVRLAGAWTGGSNDVLTLRSTATNYWAEVSRSDN